MKKTFIISFLTLAMSGFFLSAAEPVKPSPEEVKALTKRVADWQISTHEDMGKYRALPRENLKKWHNRNRYHELEWTVAALYAGMYEWSTIADDDTYVDWLMDIGVRNDWQLHERLRHADDHAVGQFYLSLYESHGDAAMLEPTRTQFDELVATADDEKIEWYWADALFMAPPVWARLAKITGDKRYLEFMDAEYRKTYDALWDSEEQLFYRDNSYKTKFEENGKNVFWSRGNGWVFGGLALLIPDLPKEWEGRAFYIEMFNDLAETLERTQRADGTWSMGMLGSEEYYSVKEISGTAFFVFGLARGIKQGWLDREQYEPVLLNAWGALSACVRDDGLLGYVQPVGAAPGDSFPDYTEVYGVGAFLAAGTEVFKLYDNAMEPKAFSRFVPERQDDFAWENDKVAFRAYGPAAREKTENSGFDCWLKRVEYPIIDKWYAQMKEKSYHTDWGEGYDPYHVGSSAGCGGTGIWLDGKREPLEAFTEYEVIENISNRSQFTLSYEREVDGVLYSELKTITIELGSNMFSVHSVFRKDGEIAADLPVCVGVTTHDGKAMASVSLDKGWVSCWETIDGSQLGTAVKMKADRVLECIQVYSKKKDESHVFILANTDSNGVVEYSAGYGWEKAGEFSSRADWEDYLDRL